MLVSSGGHLSLYLLLQTLISSDRISAPFLLLQMFIATGHSLPCLLDIGSLCKSSSVSSLWRNSPPPPHTHTLSTDISSLHQSSFPHFCDPLLTSIRVDPLPPPLSPLPVIPDHGPMIMIQVPLVVGVVAPLLSPLLLMPGQGLSFDSLRLLLEPSIRLEHFLLLFPPCPCLFLRIILHPLLGTGPQMKDRVFTVCGEYSLSLLFMVLVCGP